MNATLTTASSGHGMRPGDVVRIGDFGLFSIVSIDSACDITITALRARFTLASWEGFVWWWRSVALPTIWSWNPCNGESP